MRQRWAIGFAVLVLIGAMVSPAFAQGASGDTAAVKPAIKFSTKGVRFDAPALATTSAPRQINAGGLEWHFLVLGGFATSRGRFGYGGAGWSVGAGLIANNFLDHEEFGLQGDVMYTNFGDYGCGGLCGDFRAHTTAVAVAFLYYFDKMDNGWQFHVGAGPVISHFSWGYTFANLGGVYGGGQAQAGLNKVLDNGRTFGVEARVQSVVGGAGLVLATLRF